MNYWVYFNQRPVIDEANLLIMDDAHLAEHCLHSLFSVEIDKLSHETLFKTVIAELQSRFPEYPVFDDALLEDTPPSSITELLSFIDQEEVVKRIRDIVDASPYLEKDTDFRFRWNCLRADLHEANIYISPRAIWIRPYIYPLMSIPHYERVQQCIYMSATIGDPSDLSRRLGVRPIKKISGPPKYNEKTAGRRLVVMDPFTEEEIPNRQLPVILAALRIHPKSVWLCSSKDEASKYKSLFSEWLNSHGLVGHPTWLLTPLGEEIDAFKQAPQGHLFVAGRYDGMDFNANECRLVVITTLPRAINLQEEFISAYLRDFGFMRRRLNQRIVQALGRCNRSDEDFGVYVLADQRFTVHFGRELNREGIPRNIVAEIDIAEVWAEIEVETLVQRVQDFLRKDFHQYDEDLQIALIALQSFPLEQSTNLAIPDTSEKEVMGWTALFASHNYVIAASRFEECWDAAKMANLIEMGAFHGWHWSKALYLQSTLNEPSAREKALQLFEQVIDRGGQSSWFNRMRASLKFVRKAIRLS